ncbi:MAG: glycosyltransferase [Chloroflexota bacterium]|nr:MAG: glycosyltransferase [Chloroflexota bacterium]
MRIVQIIDSFEMGGAQSLQVTFANEVLCRGHDLTVISLTESRDTAVEKSLRHGNTSLVFLPSDRLLDRKRIRRLACVLKDCRADVVQTHLTYSNILGSLAGKMAGVPVVATLHNEMYDPGWTNRARYLIETMVVQAAARKIVAVGYQVGNSQKKRFPAKKITVIPNAVNIPNPLSHDECMALKRELLGDPEQPVLITIGRLARQKGLIDLLDSFAALRREQPGVRLVIIGDGSFRPQLEEHIHALQLEQSVFLLGERSDARLLLPAGDIYVSASHWEGLPVAVLEAMAAGLPVVATRVGDLPYIVVDGSGRLVEPREPLKLARALGETLADPEKVKRMGQAAREYVVRNHHPRVWVDHLLDTYYQARNETPPQAELEVKRQ